MLKSGDAQGLDDGSIRGDWRLPTITELEGLVSGKEAVSSSTPRFFVGIDENNRFWSSTSTEFDRAYIMPMSGGGKDPEYKDVLYGVWPVRPYKR